MKLITRIDHLIGKILNYSDALRELSSEAFSTLPRDCTIYVPEGKLTAYTSASNYPSSSQYTYVEE